MRSRPENKKIILDFDLTISAILLENAVIQIERELRPQMREDWIPPQLIWNKLLETNQLKPTGTASQWREIIHELLAQNHSVYIINVPFPDYEYFIGRFMRDVIQLPEEDIGRVKISPSSAPSKTLKNVHLDYIAGDAQPNAQPFRMTDNERKTAYANMVLIDDSQRNIQAFQAVVGHNNNSLLVNGSDNSTPQRIKGFLMKFLGLSHSNTLDNAAPKVEPERPPSPVRDSSQAANSLYLLKGEIELLPHEYLKRETGIFQKHKKDLEQLVEKCNKPLNTNGSPEDAYKILVENLEKYFLDRCKAWKQSQSLPGMKLFKRVEVSAKDYKDFINYLNKEPNGHHASRLVTQLLSKVYNQELKYLPKHPALQDAISQINRDVNPRMILE